MTRNSDDAPLPKRGVVRPPPSLAPDDAPEVEVPRMEPPPPSLEAMVQSTGRGRAKPEPSRRWLLWLALALVALGITAYVMR